ncbi:hypothetical protein RAMLITH_15935 [Ramlibacter sp. RBP-2]|uniref:Lipoprotein n=1 Tax=Ramlibacter lithotrophicus TaxID=2606681 RepID=A0A7X6I7H5_9BURK|nr:hypothetical protein [Ramlibacter lithotrophicus]
MRAAKVSVAGAALVGTGAAGALAAGCVAAAGRAPPGSPGSIPGRPASACTGASASAKPMCAGGGRDGRASMAGRARRGAYRKVFCVQSPARL